jgi:hypothetical protein
VYCRKKKWQSWTDCHIEEAVNAKNLRNLFAVKCFEGFADKFSGRAIWFEWRFTERQKVSYYAPVSSILVYHVSCVFFYILGHVHRDHTTKFVML